jgi:hypothetical protein
MHAICVLDLRMERFGEEHGMSMHGAAHLLEILLFRPTPAYARTWCLQFLLASTLDMHGVDAYLIEAC